jgi:hypothetical protein
MIRRHPWIAPVACAAIAITLPCWSYVSKSRPDERAVTAAEDEVYEAVVRDMVAATRGQGNINQLVFDGNVLTGLATRAEMKACQERVREPLRLEDHTPPVDPIADTICRILTRGRHDGWLRADTIQDFLNKSCTEGPLSRTFHTDLPRVFIKSGSVFFDLAPNHRNGLKDFGQTFPGASGIIYLSHIGFDSALGEAIIYTSFSCGALCGSGQLYILRKKQGRWEVTGNSIVWAS